MMPMKKGLVIFLIWFPFFLAAQPPDDPVTPVEAVSMLGKGILFEPQAGDVDFGISAPYKPEYGDFIRDAGFRSVRIRYQGARNPMMVAIADGPPYDAADDALLDELENIIDDLLNKNLAVVITFYGLTKDNPGDLDKMVSWWGYVAERFRNKSHRLIFNLFVEPWSLIHNADPQRIAVYYREITKEIRKTNPDRLIIYFKVPPENAADNPYGPGTEWFITKDFDPIPPEAGIWYLWDFHVLKGNARDNIRLIEQAWEYSDSTKEAVWSGAWAAKTDENEMWHAMPLAIGATRRFIDRGIPSAYLMMFDGHTGIFDAQNDHNGNGILDEWSWPGLVDTLTAGPDVWWNLLSDPGFERDDGTWTYEGGSVSREGSPDEHSLRVVPPVGGEVRVSQDVTLAMQHNGPGKTSFLAQVTAEDTCTVTFAMESVSTGGSYLFKSDPLKVVPGKPLLLRHELDLAWDGELQNAVWVITLSGGTAHLDKTGLTRFFYDDPRLDPSLWPGERIHRDEYTSRSNSTIDLNILTRNLLNRGKNDGNPDILAFTRAIDSITYDLETRLIELIGSDYQRTSEGLQYRLGGYNPGGDNREYKNLVDKYVSGKDQQAYDLNQALIRAQNEARDHLILTDMDYRSFFYEVWRGWPPTVTGRIPVSRQVSLSGSTLTAAEEGAEYRWLDCDCLLNPVRDATTRSFTPPEKGHYAVEVRKNGYTVVSDCYEVQGTSVKVPSRPSSVTLYPNPATDYLWIEAGEGNPPQCVRIYHANGRLIRSYPWRGTFRLGLPLSLKPGFYLIEVVGTQGKETRKLLVR